MGYFYFSQPRWSSLPLAVHEKVAVGYGGANVSEKAPATFREKAKNG